MTDDRMTEALTGLIEAVSALGFERARDAISAYGDEADEDAAVWHAAFLDAVNTAVLIGALAAGEDERDCWIAFGDAKGFSATWAWRDGAEAYHGLILSSIQNHLGSDDLRPRHSEALRMALPVMRRTAAEYLESVMVRHDPATIAAAEWAEIAPDLDAILAAEACVGRIPDDEDRDRLWLDPILDAREWRKPDTRRCPERDRIAGACAALGDTP